VAADRVDLSAKASLASPTFTGNPIAPTQSAGNNSTRIATTAYVDTLSTGIDWETSARTANFTAVAGKGYAVDCSGAARTVTLPAGSVGDIIALVDYSGNAATNNITITANGSEKILGATSDVILNVGRMAVHLVYFDTTQGWIIPWGVQNPVLPPFATGGTTSDYAGYKVHSFLSGSTDFVVNVSGIIDVLMVAGGGGGGSHHAGAGGAGGVIVATGITIVAGTYSMVVGAGGAANAYGAGDNGSNTTAFGATATGGGSGGKYQTTAPAAGGSGGGGNGTDDNSYNQGASGTQANVTSGTLSGATGYGNDGGNSNYSHLGGGGGGAGAVGGNYVPNSDAGVGGIGIQNLFRTGSNVYYGGGGGGGNWSYTVYAAGGNGGGGAGGGGGNATTAIGTDGAVNTGGGGGGSGSQGVRAGGDGGSGIVVIRYAV